MRLFLSLAAVLTLTLSPALAAPPATQPAALPVKPFGNTPRLLVAVKLDKVPLLDASEATAKNKELQDLIGKRIEMVLNLQDGKTDKAGRRYFSDETFKSEKGDTSLRVRYTIIVPDGSKTTAKFGKSYKIAGTITAVEFSRVGVTGNPGKGFDTEHYDLMLAIDPD